MIGRLDTAALSQGSFAAGLAIALIFGSPSFGQAADLDYQNKDRHQFGVVLAAQVDPTSAPSTSAPSTSAQSTSAQAETAQPSPSDLPTTAASKSFKSIDEISLDIANTSNVPDDRYRDEHAQQESAGAPMWHGPKDGLFYSWVAPGTVNNPLYFEDVSLERYGQGYNPFLQPLVSGINFASDAILLPYQMGLDSPHELNYTLGYHRPGNWAPAVRKHLPWSWKGAAMQAGVFAGTVSLFPVP